MQKNFHIGKFFERARRRSLRLDITRRAIGVERSFLLWAPAFADLIFAKKCQHRYAHSNFFAFAIIIFANGIRIREI